MIRLFAILIILNLLPSLAIAQRKQIAFNKIELVSRTVLSDSAYYMMVGRKVKFQNYTAFIG